MNGMPGSLPLKAKPVLLEICVDTAQGLAAAAAGGADRIELCSTLALGGLTPSAGLMALAGRQGLPVRAMIRPRAGHFTYDAAEAAIMADDIARARDAGLEGVVIGAAHAQGVLDVGLLERLVRASGGMAVTLHRVVDLLPAPREAVAIARALGIGTILTSGGARHATDGLAELAAMVEAAGDAVTIMAGSGVKAGNVVGLIAATGVHAVHASCAHAVPRVDPRMVDMGFAPAREAATDQAAVADLRAMLDSITAHG
jgi:copper homeostasis protein